MKQRALAASIVVLLVVGLVALAAACGSSGGGTSGGSSATPTSSGPVKGGTLNVSFEGEPTGLDPAHAWENQAFFVERTCYEGLIDYASKPGLAGTELVPKLATAVPSAANGGISKDGTTYTFHIRKGVMFQAPVSREVTSADFKYSFLRMLRQTEAPTFFYAGVEGAQAYIDKKTNDVSGITTPDKYTIVFKLSSPDASFLYAMSMPFTDVVSKEWVAKQGKNFIRDPLGTGPFIFVKWVSGQSITMKKNPNYWDKGKPYLDAIDYSFTANPTTEVLQVQRGQTDLMADSLSGADVPRLKADPTWSKYVISAPQIAWFYTFMNTIEKPFSNVKVRQAVNYAINTKKISKILAGQGTALNQIYPDGMPGHQKTATFYTYDPAKAKQLLKEAGYPNGFKTTFYSHNVDPFPKLAQAIQADLKAVGISADIKLMDRSSYWNYITYKKNKVPIGLSDWYMDFPDPSDWIGPLFSASSAVDGGQNSSWFVNNQVDTLYKQSAAELDPAKRLQMFVQMQQIIMDQAPTAPLYQPLWNAFYGQHAGGVYVQPVWIFNVAEMWKTK